jgi:hypothetical protein
LTTVPNETIIGIKAIAASEWPGDYAMQAHVVEQQSEAYLTMASYLTQLDIYNEVIANALSKAQTDWPTDFTMQVHVFEGQMESAGAFFSYANAAIPEHVLEAIKVNAFGEWPGDYQMMVYALEQQVDGWIALNG